MKLFLGLALLAEFGANADTIECDPNQDVLVECAGLVSKPNTNDIETRECVCNSDESRCVCKNDACLWLAGMNACPLDYEAPRYTDCVATLQANDIVKPDCICQDDLELYVSASLGPACRDVDECASGVNNRCGAFSECVNKNPTVDGVGYLCSCDTGYGCLETDERNCTRGGGHMDLDAGCFNTDECATGDYECRANSNCEDTEGSYICPCADGFREEGTECVDILECSNGSANCEMECEELPGTYQCYCETGYEINAANPKTCDQVDECLDPNACGDPNSSCTDTDGSFECACNTNWEEDSDATSFACKDRDECIEGTHTCQGHSDCSNKEEGFDCPCSTGYERTGGLATDGSDGSTSACTDINECSDPNNNPCGENSTCDNIGGSYNCGCQDGFEDRDGTCQDILECNDPNLNNCHALATCTETPGSFECICNENYWGDGRDDGHCTSLAECDIGTDVCGPDTLCIEAEEGFMCQCSTTGYYPDPEQAWPTVDDNKLICTLSTCGPGEGACTVDKATGDITCTATRNYIQLPQCIDYNECNETTDKCGSLGNCNNLDQAYECVCIEGAQPSTRDPNGNVIECENINECNLSCSSRINANCNDCLENVAACDDRIPDKNNGASTNYVCNCIDGYTTSFTFDWTTWSFTSACVDEDECLGTAHNCGFHATCVNQNMLEHNEKFKCDCEDGYVHDTDTESRFYNCIDIEECSSPDLNSCDPVTQVCVEEEPGYTCQCAWGYHAEAVVGSRTLVCTDDNECGMPEGELDQDGTARMKCDVFSTNPTSECSNNDGSYSCTCLTGYDQATMNSTNLQTCLNLDECDTAADYCAQTFECQNCTCTDSDMFATGVTHECDCVAGFTKTLWANIEGSTPNDFTYYCKDDNECLSASTNNCDINNGFCTNIDGGFTCECKIGYQTVDGADEGTECENVDECATGEHNCHEQATCADNTGSFTCECNKGWTGPGDTCLDFLECEDQRAAGYSFNAQGNSWFGSVLGRMNSFIGLGQDFVPCDDRAFCTEQEGSYLCQCLDGLTGDGYTCEDVDECTDASLNACAAPVDIDEDSEGIRAVTRSICSNIDVTDEFDETWTKGYSCACLDGLEGEGENCLDIDECLVDGGNTCHAQATCNNFFGRSKYELGYTCTCPDYLDGDGHSCTNIDECLNADLNNCGASTECADNDNEISGQTDFTCSCLMGFEHDESVTGMYSCINIDECATDAHDCADEGSECTDTVGGYECSCIAGYYGDGVTCLDYDECSGENNGHFCGANTYCNNLPGSFECHCNDGFTDLENVVIEGAAIQICSDFINCVAGENECDIEHAVCNEFVGLGEDGFGYTCSCDAGWTVTLDSGRTCDNENECTNGYHTCDVENGSCSDTTGSFTCSCNTGYTMDDNGICQDDDECVLGTNDCDKLQGICHNNAGSYTCTCATGYQTTIGAIEGYVCEDTDECLGSNLCHADATCTNTDGSYTCLCNTGYEDLDSTDFSGSGDEGSGGSDTVSSYFSGSNCVNIDECTTGGHSCDVNASCTDNTGSYTCTCSEPWRVTSDEGRTCEDFDECSAASENECHMFASCTNTDGSYFCACNDGYETATDSVEGTNCIDIDECDTETDNCSEFAECENRVPNFACHCNAGYRVTDDEGVTCTNEDECLNVFEQNQCMPTLATCHDTEGTYTCQCATGYEGDGFGTSGCQDVDECVAGTHTCDDNAVCTNNVGSFACQCNVGWRSADDALEPGFACVDIDECTEDIDNCDIHATCTDTDGSYTCECNEGYENIDGGIGHQNDCINIDECIREIDECDSINSVCKDDVGSYMCECNAGWTNTTTAGMGEESCGNWNECLNNDDNLCDTDEGRGGVCIDNDGAYTCECDDLAWSVLGDDGYACTNYDECSNPEHNNCDKDHATCQDTDGSYTCTCEIGWTNTDDEGATCNDVDECANESHDCDVNSTCQNTLGSYECHCNDGWQSDSVEADAVCTDIDECDADTPTHSCDANAACSNNDGSYYCLCNMGYYSATNSSEAICGDVDECAGASADGTTPEHSCSDNSTCENTTGSYVCNCNLGWESENDGQTETECSDIDECDAEASLQHNCDPNASCINNDGSYNCACNVGWYSDSNESDAVCGDVDECIGASADGVTSEASCDLNSACRNTEGTYECDCKPGWFSGSTDADMVCEDHDECVAASPDGVTAMHSCHEHASCEDTDGSYFCNCDLGWYSSTNGADAVCENVDECVAASADGVTSVHSCDVNADCVDTDGSYECHCASGWKSDSTDADIVCVNVDECSESTHNTEMGSCAVNSICADTDGSYECHCDIGWQNVNGNMESDAICEDIDECAGIFNCNDLSSCVNTPGTYLCSCIDGYADGSTDAPGECRNIDECVELNEDGSAMFECAEFSVCNDTDGDYECVCSAGFEQTEFGHPATCTDYDECAGENGGNDCGENADCTNTNGGFECSCAFGYQDIDADTEMPGRECELIINCLDGNNGGCSHHCEIPSGCQCPGSCWSLNEEWGTQCAPDETMTTVECGPGQMDISIDACLFDHSSYTMHLHDQNCVSSGSMEDGSFELTTALDDCGTQLEFTGEQVIFHQMVYGYAIAGDLFLGRPTELEFTCSYNTNYDTEGDDIVVANIDATTDRHGAGSFEFNVDFYTDSSYGTESDASDVITVGEQVYFGVSAANLPSSVSFSIMDCTVTNTNGVDLSYYIVENFCPDVYTRTDFSGKNMQKDSVFLHYQAFKFTGVDDTESEEVLSCRVIVCNDADGENTCANQPDCSNGRRRRSSKDFQPSKIFQIQKSYRKGL